MGLTKEQQQRKRQDQLKVVREKYGKQSIASLARQLKTTQRRVVAMAVEAGVRPASNRRGQPQLWVNNKGRKYWVQVDLDTGKRYYLHIEKWEVRHGKIPEGYNLRCRTDDTQDPEPENWEIVSHAEMMARNRNHEKTGKSIEKVWAKARRWKEMGMRPPTGYKPVLNSPYIRKKQKQRRKNATED